MNILILTNIYPGPGMEKDNTPVVHYFTREWAAMGHKVYVVHYAANFPRPVMWAAALVKKPLAALLGTPVRTTIATEHEYTLEGVHVKCIPMTKYYLHAPYNKQCIDRAFHKTVSWLQQNDFTPDIVSSHWVNPQVEIMLRLKQLYSIKACYVAHIPPFEFERIYSRQQTAKMLMQMDMIGFRSLQIKKEFENQYKLPVQKFMCYSGVPESFLCANNIQKRQFNNVRSFIFVGAMYPRKHPDKVLEAVVQTYGKEPFRITFIGQGEMEKKIRNKAQRLGISESVHILGRQSREQVVRHLSQNDVFIMISKKETYGLVYLEAMAQGCITVASRHEGFDGIIVDNQNGFLCKAGDTQELCGVINKIRKMTSEELCQISNEAINTATALTDRNTATTYLNNLTISEPST